MAGAAYLVTYFEIAPAEGAKAVAALRLYAGEARHADGNIGLLALRERDRPGRFAMIEGWRDQAALDAHMAAAKALADQLRPDLVSPFDSRQSIPLDIADRSLDAGPELQAAVFVLTHVDVLPTGKDTAVELVRALAAASRRQNGNLVLDVLQQANRANHMTLFEGWRDRAAYEAYIVADPTKDFRAKLTPLAGALYDERLYEPIL
ncbi:MAG: antibiotic biosynthesis monooxygenase [Alphaproteobacteria bacterium]|nr:antibiotic biosynthesis monooxygenase [Alphaproteobacteria bacterium]